MTTMEWKRLVPKALLTNCQKIAVILFWKLIQTVVLLQ